MRSILLPILASVSIACGATVPPPDAPPAPNTPPAVVDAAPPAATPPVATPPVATPPAPPSPPAAPPRVASDVSRIQAGEWPGSNRHKFGGRWYEVKRQGDGFQFRLHDEIHFQGVGMKPSQMPPTNHQCTPWEKVPENVAQALSKQSLPAGDETGAGCAQLGTTCNAIKGWLTATTKRAPASKKAPPEVEMVQMMAEEAASTYGRGQGDCN